MKKLLVLLFVLAASILVLCSCECKHKEVSSATCTEPSKCLSCDAVLGEATGHTEGEWITDREATCVEEGSLRQVCATCGVTLATDAPAALGHTAGDWVVDKAPDCDEDGSRHQDCSVCGQTLVVGTLDKRGHVAGEWITDLEATCVEDGSRHKNCTVCDEVVLTETLKQLGHKEGNWVVDKAANCTEDGSRHKPCSVCGETVLTATINKNGHTNGAWVVDQDATCTEDGSRHCECSVCGVTTKTEKIDKLGHSYKESTINRIGDRQAQVVHNCTRCSHQYSEYVPRIQVKVTLTSSGISMTNVIRYTREFKVEATGGYGTYRYKYEVYSYNGAGTPALTEDFSKESEFGYSSTGSNVDNTVLKVTVIDDVGNETVYRITGGGDFVDSSSR